MGRKILLYSNSICYYCCHQNYFLVLKKHAALCDSVVVAVRSETNKRFIFHYSHARRSYGKKSANTVWAIYASFVATKKSTLILLHCNTSVGVT